MLQDKQAEIQELERKRHEAEKSRLDAENRYESQNTFLIHI